MPNIRIYRLICAAVILGVIFTSAFIFQNAFKRLDSQNWQAHPARFIDINFDTRPGHRGGQIYSVKCKYQYVWEGVTYQSTRVHFNYPTRNQALTVPRNYYDKLYFANGSKINSNIYVNPKKPSQAVVFIDDKKTLFSVSEIFTLFLLSLSIPLLISLAIYLRDSQRRYELSLKHPRKPWMWNQYWQDGVIQSRAERNYLIFAAYTVIFNIIGCSFVLAMMKKYLANELGQGAYLALLFAFGFSSICLCMIPNCVQKYKQWQYFQDATLELESMPISRGPKALNAVLILPYSPPLDAEFEVTLQYGEGEILNSSPIWENTQLISLHSKVVRDPPYRLALTLDMPEKYADHYIDFFDMPRYYWRLNINVYSSGTEFKQSFELPVFSSDHWDVA